MGVGERSPGNGPIGRVSALVRLAGVRVAGSGSRQPVDGSPALAGSGGGGGALGSSMRWGGGEAAVGVAVKSPAALMDRPVVGPAHQGQIGQVGGAAVQPMAEMAARWAAVTTRPARPTSSGWVGPPPRAGGSRVAATRSRATRVSSPPGWWRVTSTRVTVPSQASRRQASGPGHRSRRCRRPGRRGG
jgi:hypothetical protein